MIKINPKKFSCKKCKLEFEDLDAEKVCSNCFACTGCEIYNCPHCGAENIYRPVKKMDKN